MNMNYCKRSRFFSILSSVLLFSVFLSSGVKAQDGKSLFSSNCAQCHSVGKGTVIGPDLKDVHKRRPEDWLLKWVKSSQSVVKSGDAYAVELFNKFNKTEMPNFQLADAEVKAILAYVKDEGSKAPAPVASSATPGKEGEAGAGETNWALYLTIAALLLWALAVALAKVKRTLIKVHNEKQGLPDVPHRQVTEQVGTWMKNNKRVVALGVIILMIIGSKIGWDALASIGISQNYQPDQPIAFSHKIHAGENGINCVYCHSGAEKGKTAGIPSANVCMNCHKGIKSGTNTGTEEIAKIYKALDYNPETMTYGNNPKPLQWVRVHNLPDFAYFNHSQHVKVGGQKCQTCHGPVEEMTVAKQFSPLTMGWCIDCHRNTEVKMEGNHYYDEYHKKLAKKYGDKKITVEAIGGTECARCHY